MLMLILDSEFIFGFEPQDDEPPEEPPVTKTVLGSFKYALYATKHSREYLMTDHLFMINPNHPAFVLATKTWGK